MCITVGTEKMEIISTRDLISVGIQIWFSIAAALSLFRAERAGGGGAKRRRRRRSVANLNFLFAK